MEDFGKPFHFLIYKHKFQQLSQDYSSGFGCILSKFIHHTNYKPIWNLFLGFSVPRLQVHAFCTIFNAMPLHWLISIRNRIPSLPRCHPVNTLIYSNRLSSFSSIFVAVFFPSFDLFATTTFSKTQCCMFDSSYDVRSSLSVAWFSFPYQLLAQYIRLFVQ